MPLEYYPQRLVSRLLHHRHVPRRPHGRKSLGILSQSLLTLFLFLVGALTKSEFL